MDEEILKLQQELMAVQKTESRRALSERNVVELLIKLRELGLVRFIHSVNGREMITPEQLIREIEMVIWQKRRISVVDIPNELGVDFVHVDSSISAVLERNAKEFQKIGNEILTQSYLDDLAVELSEELNMSGSMTVTDVATKKSLPAEFVVAFLKEQIYRGLLSAQMDGNTLLTHSYLSKERARVLGAFLGICTPVAIRNVASQHGMREDHCIRALQELVREGHVHGVVEQGGSVFVPHRFKIAQKRALVNFFNQNGFLSHDRVEKARINLDMKRLVEEEGWDGILLSNVFFGRNVLDRVDEEIVSSLSIGSQNQEKEKECDVVDIVGLLPEIIDSNEVSKLLAECPRTQVGIRSGNILTVAHSTVLANKDLERKAQEHVIELLTRKIEEWAADRNKRGDGSLSPVSKPKPKKAAKGDRKARKKRGGKGKRKGKRGDDSDDDDDDDAGVFPIKRASLSRELSSLDFRISFLCSSTDRSFSIFSFSFFTFSPKTTDLSETSSDVRTPLGYRLAMIRLCLSLRASACLRSFWARAAATSSSNSLRCSMGVFTNLLVDFAVPDVCSTLLSCGGWTQNPRMASGVPNHLPPPSPLPSSTISVVPNSALTKLFHTSSADKRGPDSSFCARFARMLTK
eukprot:TRINITY_DN423_c0_g1_i1.p1 TRINITY_DN423_c0_g1~~TRINITY_DN423_c0_g1_i1.p1  ORF type:complete len:633 (-),score=176.08 TRINITY_DN423_c0_g1_i1:446-2344(-)